MTRPATKSGTWLLFEGGYSRKMTIWERIAHFAAKRAGGKFIVTVKRDKRNLDR